MMNNTTIRARLTVFYGALFLLAGAVLLFGTYVLVQQTLSARVSSKDVVVFGPPEAPASPGGEVMVRTKDGRRIPLAEAGVEVARQQERFRQQTLDTLLTRGTITLVAVSAVAIGLGWLLADRTLRPLHRITETARRVADRNMHERIALPGPRGEIKELADTFDSMLERLDRSFDGQHRFVANASHELRTPLTISRTLIEVALGRPDVSEQTRQLGQTLLTVNARHERLLDGLLTLVRSDQRITVEDPVDLADVVRYVVDQSTTEPAVKVLTSLEPAPTAGDPVLLERVVRNLVDNAVKYNVEGGSVWVSTALAGDRVHLVVENTGPVVPRYEVPNLFEPFRRLHDRINGAHGAGLGLSIVRSVTLAHGGTVTAQPREDGGLEVSVALPARPA